MYILEGVIYSELKSSGCQKGDVVFVTQRKAAAPHLPYPLSGFCFP